MSCLVQLTLDVDGEVGGGVPGWSPLVLDHHSQLVLVTDQLAPPRHPDNMNSSTGVESEVTSLVSSQDAHLGPVLVPRVEVSEGDDGDQLTNNGIISNGEITELNLRSMTVGYLSTTF